MTDKWTIFIQSVITVIAIIIIAGVIFEPNTPSDVRYVTYLSFAVVVILVTVVSDSEYKKEWTWETRMENAGFGIFISLFLYVHMKNYSEPGLVEYWGGEEHGYRYIFGDELQSTFYFVILLMVVYFYLNYSFFREHKGFKGLGKEEQQKYTEEWQKIKDECRQNLPRPNPSKIYHVKPMAVRGVNSFAMQIYGKPFDQLTSEQKEKLMK